MMSKLRVISFVVFIVFILFVLIACGLVKPSGYLRFDVLKTEKEVVSE